jgi:hypothetical protein
MARLEQIDLKVPGGDSVYDGFERTNRNVDILNSQTALATATIITVPQALTISGHLGKRVNINLTAPGTVSMPSISELPDQDGVILLRNLGGCAAVIGPAAGTRDRVGLSSLYPGEAVLMDGYGGAWNVLMRSSVRGDDERNPNLLINGSGEFGNVGWKSANFSSTSGMQGEGYLFLNGGAIGRDVEDASEKIQISANVTLALRAEISMPGASSGNAYVSVRAYDANGAFLGQVAQALASRGTGWTCYSGSGVTPTNTAYVVVGKGVDTSPAVSASGVGFRHIKLEQGASSAYSQEGSLAYLQKAPALDGRPTFAGNVPWDSGNLPVSQCYLTTENRSLLLTGKNGRYISIQGVARKIPPRGVLLDGRTAVAGTRYYVYAFMSDQTVALEAVVTGYVIDDGTGMPVKIDDPSRTLVGMAYCVATGSWEQGADRIDCLSYFNRKERLARGINRGGSGQADTTWLALPALSWGDEVSDVSVVGWGSTTRSGNTSSIYVACNSIGVGVTQRYSNNTGNYSFPVGFGVSATSGEGRFLWELRGMNDGQLLTMDAAMYVKTFG